MRVTFSEWSRNQKLELRISASAQEEALRGEIANGKIALEVEMALQNHKGHRITS